ncbi:hypothetical protein E4U59_006948 [Claviceps monticola]|nr:hypothetical protein E4U59_006948 [Claviceps monticola]
MAPSRSPNRAGARWTMRIVPLFMICFFGLATYAVVVRLCVQYVLRSLHNTAVAVVVLVLYCLLFILALSSYLRVFFAIQRDPGFVPLLQDIPSKSLDPAEKKGRKSRSSRLPDPETASWCPPDTDLDSPGLETFYSRDVFSCEVDGRPRWCSNCRQWKPDRAHHSGELGRCVRKMDHLCPWVGGMVSETSFNFFFHFTFYGTWFCALCLAISVYCLTQQLNSQDTTVDGWVIAIVALSAFFLLFAFGMTLTAGRYIFTNTTNIDLLRKRQFSSLAVRIPSDTPPSSTYKTITYPLQITQNGPSTSDAHLPHYATGSTIDMNAARDKQATRTFAILTVDGRENPWDLGLRENWKSVMGTSVVEWFLPLRHSPCCKHDSMWSEYPVGPLVSELRRRYGVPDLDDGVSRDGAREVGRA